MTDKLGAAVGASVLTAQGTRGVISTWKLKHLFISVWREKYNGCQIDFFTIQIPRCKNFEQEYFYTPVSCSDSDFMEIMKRVREWSKK